MKNKKVTPEVAMRRLYERGNTVTEIAELYSLSESKVESILKLNEMPNGKKQITQAQKSQVLKLKKQGVTHRVIQKKTGVSLSSIDRIVNPKRANRQKENRSVKPAPSPRANRTSRKSTFRLLWGAFEIVKETA
jgi:uncharacterized protein YerC